MKTSAVNANSQVADKALFHGELALSLGRKSVELPRRREGAADDVAPDAVADENEETAGPERADDRIAKPALVGFAFLVVAEEIDDGHLGWRRLAYRGKVDHRLPPVFG
ncbi:MAG: hypothetical protein WAO08_07710 [Hyphomicrobiaceae bacterium]